MTSITTALPPAAQAEESAAIGRLEVARTPAVAAEAGLLALHSLGWLVAGCAVGLLLATLLLLPAAGELLVPLSYGRWVPLHLDFLLYGWCGLPLLALLVRLYLPAGADAAVARLAAAAWSGTLAAGGASWLAGGSSGKLFLEWAGVPRWLFLGQLVVLAGALAVAWRRAAAGERARQPRRPGAAAHAAEAGRWLLLALLAGVPLAMLLATSAGTYPPIDPDTGGPTGASLAASTIGVLAIFWLLPLALGLPRRRQPRAGRLAVLLGAHGLLVLALGHGDHSHREPLQILVMASLLVWLPLLARYLLAWHWSAPARPWLAALAAWGGLLLASALPTFLPGLLDRAKFTDLLVAHAHLAMAGMATSFAALLLASLEPATATGASLAAQRPFALWHLGLLVQLAALVGAGLVEARDPGAVTGSAAVTGWYVLRWLGGAAMLAAAWSWLRAALPGGGRAALAEAP